MPLNVSLPFFSFSWICVLLCVSRTDALFQFLIDKQFGVFPLSLVSLYLRCKCSSLKFDSQKRRKWNLEFKWCLAFVPKVTVSVSESISQSVVNDDSSLAVVQNLFLHTFWFIWLLCFWIHLFCLSEFECLVTLDVSWPEWSLRLWSFSFEIIILDEDDCLCLAWQIIIERMIELLLFFPLERLITCGIQVDFVEWREKNLERNLTHVCDVFREEGESIPFLAWLSLMHPKTLVSWLVSSIITSKGSLMICEWLLSITFTLESCLWCKTRKPRRGRLRKEPE